MTEPDATVKENAQNTIRETPKRTTADATLIYSAVSAGTTTSAINNFRGWQITEQLPTKGAEADIFIVDASGKRHVLKLYRHRLEPKIEILNRITAISRANSHCFVTYLETGFDETTGRWYELQEFIRNGSVKDLPRDVKREQNFIAQFIPELATTIQCLHDNGIIHCDIKPANVLVRNLEPLDLVLADFGISSLVASDMSRKMTSLKGTPMYWAPEAFSKTVSRASDWWGLGIMLLEMLAGEHPFDGMSDSEIIRELTLGNVEIPSSIGDDFGLLVKGLLTKDDTKRWGKSEIDRWLAGARDIPVHYEGAKISEQDDVKPFQFANVVCRTVGEIATAFAYNEGLWESPADYLRYIRHWYESNLMFDDAERHSKAYADTSPELALFRFVHSNEELPFAIFGHRADAEGLCEILRRAIGGALSKNEARLLEILDNGELISYYGEYADRRGGDQSYPGLLKFIAKKPRAEQLEHTLAHIRPGDYVWPDGVDAQNPAERLAFARKISSPPLRREDFSRAAEKFVIPAPLAQALASRDAYDEGAARFRRWTAKNLMLPRIMDRPRLHSNGMDGYERAARAYLLRVTEEDVLEIENTITWLSEINKKHQYPAIDSAINSITESLDEKMPDGFGIFMSAISRLYTQRRRITELGPKLAPVFRAASVCALALAQIPGVIGAATYSDAHVIRSFFILCATGVYLSVKHGLAEKFFARTGQFFMLVAMMGAVLALVIGLNLPKFPPASWSILIATPLAGLPLGDVLARAAFDALMAVNAYKTIDACERRREPGSLMKKFFVEMFDNILRRYAE